MTPTAMDREMRVILSKRLANTATAKEREHFEHLQTMRRDNLVRLPSVHSWRWRWTES